MDSSELTAMRARLCLMPLVIGLSFGPDGVRGQEPSRAEKAKAGAMLAVKGEVAHPLQLTAADLARMPRRTVKARDHDGKEAVFEGVQLGEVLKKSGAKVGVGLRGEMLSYYLLVQAADGYRVVFALPELDEAFTDRIVLLADRRDGKALDDHEGPLRIVVPDEKRAARWVRQVTSLEVRHSQGDLHRTTAPASSR
jgi:DMSO/TMAO reductase YedYZ molybdopterin-dependent catalytic subunit